MIRIARMPRLIVLALVLLVACKGGKSSKGRDAGVTGDGGVDPTELAGKLDKQCVAGDLEACRNLGVMYAEGVGVSPDPRRATALFAQACNGKNLSACNHLALALAEGMGVERNPQKAVEVYQQACDGGHMMACRNLGLMLRDGRGVPQDLARADKLLDTACKGKVPFACTNAGDLDAVIASKAQNPAPHWKSAVAHYKQGCETGDPTGCRQIGIAYLEARGLPRSTAAAAVWFERGCVADDPIACRVLGAMLIDGVGVARDYKRGQELLTRACDRKDDEACRLMKIAASPEAGDGGVPGSLVDGGLPLTTTDAASGAGSGPPVIPLDGGSFDAPSKTH
jgi:TPR repeat protein